MMVVLLPLTLLFLLPSTRLPPRRVTTDGGGGGGGGDDGDGRRRDGKKKKKPRIQFWSRNQAKIRVSLRREGCLGRVDAQQEIQRRHPIIKCMLIERFVERSPQCGSYRRHSGKNMVLPIAISSANWTTRARPLQPFKISANRPAGIGRSTQNQLHRPKDHLLKKLKRGKNFDPPSHTSHALRHFRPTDRAARE